jgi:propanediol utilization protein
MNAERTTDPKPRSAARDATIPVAVSARHVHLTAAAIGRLFGAGHALSIHSLLSQPGQWAARETVTLVTRRGKIEHVRVVGPPRSANQVEISRTDAVTLDLEPPVRVSGRLAKTPGVRLVGPAGSVLLDHGVVLAKRHIHVSPADARRLGLRDRELVRVAVNVRGRDLIFGDVVVRMSPDYRLELHLDTDEANAAGIVTGDPVHLMHRISERARIHERVPPVPRGKYG